MTSFEFRLVGCSQRLLLQVEAASLPDLAQELSCKRFLVGRLVAADEQATSRGIVISVSRIEAILEHE